MRGPSAVQNWTMACDTLAALEARIAGGEPVSPGDLSRALQTERVTTANDMPPLALAEPSLSEEDAQAVADCVRAGWISGVAPQVWRFEETFAAFVGTAHGVAASSGTAALHLGLAALKVGPGDEVIVPTLTFIATANAVRYTGARVVFADVSPDTWTIAPSSVAERRGDRTAAVVAVHLAGQAADMDALHSVAPDLVLVEDAAQAIGSSYRGRPVGSLGEAACFSFFPNKVITTGEGGMLVTDDEQLAARARSLRAHAKRPGIRYIHDDTGFNYRMTGLQAALGLSQFARVRDLITHRLRVGDWYRERLGDSEDFRPRPPIPWAEAVPSFFGVIARSERLRERALAALDEARVEARPMFEPLHTQAPYRDSERFPVAEDIARRAMFVPCGAAIAEGDVDRVVSVLERAARSADAGPAA